MLNINDGFYPFMLIFYLISHTQSKSHDKKKQIKIHSKMEARAIENQCYILASAQFGQHNEKRKSYGHSVAIDPWGTIIADAGGYDGPGTTCPTTTCNPDDDDIPSTCNSIDTPSLIFCDIDHDQIQSTRDRIPIKKHRENCPFS